ncbi:tryptophan 7-halogenase [Streptomyces canus]|uniref:tryptophan 7-halogenase n=1 Tax=Streptomyces canus TaxID=58343 RepID=UPI002E2B8D43|nr:tryptophan 7-halogenase [Streptomyces canus]
MIVVGGGPAGAVTAGLLAKDGRRVLLLEREKFPRYHIGESLNPGLLPALERMGLRERLDEIGYLRKYGATFVWGAGVEPWDFRFSEGSPYEYVHQVRRADFDALLLARARELGAVVVEEATVKDIVQDGERVTGVTYQAKAAVTSRTARCRMLVDASGQQHLLARRFDLLNWHDDLRNIAVWSYWQGCELYAGNRAGDTLVENLPEGWIWYIPLADGTVSIGYVTPVEQYKKAAPQNAEAFLHEQLARTCEVSRLTRNAVQVSGVRTIKDWSYQATRFQGPGWALVGDAAAFVDPLLSSGVTLAMRAAERLADGLGRVLDHPESEEAVLTRYEKNYQEFLGVILEFVRVFYDRTRLKEEYWDEAQRAIDPDALLNSKVDFVTLISGLFGTAEIFAPVDVP